MSYQDSALALAAASVQAVVKAYAALATAGFIVVGAGIVALYNLRAAALADLSLAATLNALPLGIGRPDQDVERLNRSFSTLTDRIAEDEPAVAQAKVERLAKAEPLDAFRESFQEGMVAREVAGYRRKLNAEACELCNWLAQDGKVFAPEKKMYAHPGCGCVAELVLEEKGG